MFAQTEVGLLLPRGGGGIVSSGAFKSRVFLIRVSLLPVLPFTHGCRWTRTDAAEEPLFVNFEVG